jgi:hypothetical protein
MEYVPKMVELCCIVRIAKSRIYVSCRLDLNDGGMDFGDMTLIDVSGTYVRDAPSSGMTPSLLFDDLQSGVAFADISAEQRELELRLGKGAIGLGDMVGLDADPMVLDMGGDYGEINLDLDDAAHHTVPDETQGLPAVCIVHDRTCISLS